MRDSSSMMSRYFPVHAGGEQSADQSQQAIRSMWMHKHAKRCKVRGERLRDKEAATRKMASEGSRRMMPDEPVAASAEVSDSMVSDRG